MLNALHYLKNERALDSTYWTERYESGQTGWDIGHESTPLKEFIDGLEDKSIKNPYSWMWQRIRSTIPLEERL